MLISNMCAGQFICDGNCAHFPRMSGSGEKETDGRCESDILCGEGRGAGVVPKFQQGWNQGC